ncbi:MAG: hypothetical protein KJN64_02355 [Ignavibacteria bacterium]|nr:hypothetical protein [Ignavibacteria bacterium]MBT8381455.1 hypothetical protein [Ignavibacteria bacterium]MBT8391517.1 hypothetical protein [Ignavibacteria bacterium]NNJ52209.1 hypothetical protein [Ignavibacteriaceae bacterium]NNL22685.1 hypothetical protein [Ignavibacteriaceae bacterium]
MNLNLLTVRNSIMSLLISVLLLSCGSISEFSADAYKQAVELKVISLDLMSVATKPYSDFEADVDMLKLELRKAYEFAKGRPDNEISTKQWEILIDEERNLLGGFLKRWRDEDTLSAMFVTEAQMLVSDAFDAIIGLESGKLKPSEIK